MGTGENLHAAAARCSLTLSTPKPIWAGTIAGGNWSQPRLLLGSVAFSLSVLNSLNHFLLNCASLIAVVRSLMVIGT